MVQKAIRYNHEEVHGVLLNVDERLQPLAQDFPKSQIASSWEDMPWGLSLYTHSTFILFPKTTATGSVRDRILGWKNL